VTDDIIAGLRTTINNDAEYLRPVIDRMIELADTFSDAERNMVLRQSEMLRWMMLNVERVDSASALRMWCEFPNHDAMRLVSSPSPLRTDDIYKLIDELFPDTEVGWRSGGYVIPVTFVAWVGGNCTNCSGRGLVEDIDSYRSTCRCSECDGSGWINAIGPRAVLTAPIRRLMLKDVGSLVRHDGLYEPFLPRGFRTKAPCGIDEAIRVRGEFLAYQTAEAARTAVETATLNWARFKVGMQHDIEGRPACGGK